MPFHPHTHPRSAGSHARRLILAALTLIAFTAALIGCLHHAEAAPSAPTAAPAASTAHDHHHHHHHHQLFTEDSRSVPDPDESCITHSPSRAIQETPAPRTASVPLLFIALLGLFAPHILARGRRRDSTFPVIACEGRKTRTTVCCWRI